MKHHPQLGLFCPACNPVVRALRRRALRRVTNNAHVIWADTLAQDTRRERLRQMLTEPWQRDLLNAMISGRLDGKEIFVGMPPQHPQFGTRVHESIEGGLPPQTYAELYRQTPIASRVRKAIREAEVGDKPVTFNYGHLVEQAMNAAPLPGRDQ